MENVWYNMELTGILWNWKFPWNILLWKFPWNKKGLVIELKLNLNFKFV
jgi:hypothetical protein